MAKKHPSLTANLKKFISQQKIFFVGTAGCEGLVNVSPKGMDSLNVVDDNTVRWLSVTGSGNETAAHVLENQRMTLMFCAFDGSPMILKLYGNARVIHPRDSEWQESLAAFPALPGARQIFELTIEFALTSCGMGVPIYDYKEDRDLLNTWAVKKGPEGIQQYWQDKNLQSLNGKPTDI